MDEEEENTSKNAQNVENDDNNDVANEQPYTEDPSGTNQEEGYEEALTGIFYPEIDQILWRKDTMEDGVRKTEYLIKYKDYSYLHCEWHDEAEVLAVGKNIKNKLNRFNKTFEKRMQDTV